MFLRADGTEQSIAGSIFQMQRCLVSTRSQSGCLYKLEIKFGLTLYCVNIGEYFQWELQSHWCNKVCCVPRCLAGIWDIAL